MKEPEAEGDGCHDAICFEPEAGVACPLGELYPRHAPVHQVCSRHGALHSARLLPTAAGATLLDIVLGSEEV
jgi:hypothetical protein